MHCSRKDRIAGFTGCFAKLCRCCGVYRLLRSLEDTPSALHGSSVAARTDFCDFSRPHASSEEAVDCMAKCGHSSVVLLHLLLACQLGRAIDKDCNQPSTEHSRASLL